MSIPTNLVEGTGQKSGMAFARFITISLNSTTELEYHLIVARDMRVIAASDFESLSAQAIEVRKMLYGLRNECWFYPERHASKSRRRELTNWHLRY